MRSDGNPPISSCTVQPCRERLCNLCRMTPMCRSTPKLRADFQHRHVATPPPLSDFRVASSLRSLPQTRINKWIWNPFHQAELLLEMRVSCPSSLSPDLSLLRNTRVDGLTRDEKSPSAFQSRGFAPADPPESEGSPTSRGNLLPTLQSTRRTAGRASRTNPRADLWPRMAVGWGVYVNLQAATRSTKKRRAASVLLSGSGKRGWRVEGMR